MFGFEKLLVYQKARELVKEVYKLKNDFLMRNVLLLATKSGALLHQLPQT